MLPKALLSVRRSRGRLYPRYAELEEHLGLASTLIRIYQEHVGRKRGELEEALAALETHQTFKLVRGLSELLNRRCEFESPALTPAPTSPLSPQELRSYLFRRGYVTSPEGRRAVLEEAAQEFGIGIEEIEALFWADLEEEQILKRFDPPPPIELLGRYNLSLAQTLLFDCTELECVVRGNFQEIFRRIKRLGLMSEVEAGDGEVRIRVSGPASILGQTARYGPAFAKLLPAITRAEEWALRAKIKIPGKPGPYEFSLDSSKRGLLAKEPEEEPERFDSAVEEDFARRIRPIIPDWEVKREPTVLKAGRSVFIPDFGFFLRRPGRKEPVARLYLEIVGFWTEDYLKRKLAKLKEVGAEAPLMIAVDRGLNCSAEDFISTSPREVIFYEGTLPLEPVLSRLRELAEERAKRELEELRGEDISFPLPERRVIPLEELAEEHGVGVEVIKQIIAERLAAETEGSRKLIGDKVVALEVLEELREGIEALPPLDDGKSWDYFQVKGLLEGLGLPEQALKELGYKVEWRRLLPPDARVVKAQPEAE
jgi:predicted nuclease of restriction endonuclease-like RecB superfamily